MKLNEQLTFVPSNNIENTLRFLKDNCPPDGYLISFSGGKDSLAVLECCKEAKVPYRYYMKITTVDPPELTKYVKRCHPECVRLRPPCNESMYEGIAKKGLPTRISRWCCERYKEYPADIERGGHVLIGVRAAESVARKKRVLDALGEAGRAEDPQAEERAQLVKPCMQIAGYKIYPIVWWSDNEVWDFIRARRAEYCELYDQGHVRIGCMGCPMDTGGKVDELMRWPWAYAKYRNGARRYAEQRRAAGVGLSSAWPGWEANKAIMRRMEDDGASVEDVARHDERIRKLALDWQDDVNPEYFMRRVMAWWLECPVDYWKLDELERYAASRKATP